MARWGVLAAGDLWIASWGYGYDPYAAGLFLDSEVVEQFDDETDPPSDASEFRSNAKAVRERLQLLGVKSAESAEAVAAAWARLRERETALPTRIDEVFASYVAEKRAEAHPLERPNGELLQHHLSDLDCDWQQVLRYVLDRSADDDTVELDLSNVWGHLAEVGIQRTPTFCAAALEEVRSRAVGAMPTIVLTEGSSDADVLRTAVEICRPHLAGFLSFLDYSSKVAGGVDSVVKGLRAFAAAGVANQVVGLLDNDTAGAEGVRQLLSAHLPARMTVLQLPPLSIASAYPTLGTEGLVTKDVNGIAVAIEMFLGRDVLSDEGGALSPVQLTGWVPSQRAYQGEIVGKAGLKDRFWAKAKRAREGEMDPAHWEDLGALIDHIVRNA